MEENYKLEKEYQIPFEIFKDAYSSFQKKYVYPKSYIYMGLFLIIAIIYIAAAIKDTSNTLAYVLIFVCLALAVRKWYNPRKVRRNLLDTIMTEGLENEVYKIGITDEFVDISTLPHENVENSEESEVFDGEVDGEDSDEYEDEASPEKSRIPINSNLAVNEYERYFLLHVKKSMFYVVPKDGFSEDELEIFRNTVKKK